jgi:hypothetical protein
MNSFVAVISFSLMPSKLYSSKSGGEIICSNYFLRTNKGKVQIYGSFILDIVFVGI